MSRAISWFRLLVLLGILAVTIWIYTGSLDTWWTWAKDDIHGGIESLSHSLVSFSILVLVVAGTGFVLAPAGRMGMAITAILLVFGSGNLVHTHLDAVGNYSNVVLMFHCLATLPLAALSGFWMVIAGSVGDGFSKGISSYFRFWHELFALLLGVINVFRVTDPVVRALNKQRRGGRF
jgi:hypothetical protein